MSSEAVFDQAYQVAKKANSASSHVEAKDKLQAKFPDVPWNEILNAYTKASDLVEKCYDIGDAARRENIPDDRSIHMLRETFPGFSNETYNDALTLGWFLSR